MASQDPPCLPLHNLLPISPVYFVTYQPGPDPDSLAPEGGEGRGEGAIVYCR